MFHNIPSLTLSEIQKYISMEFGPTFGHCLELNPLCKLLHASTLEPLVEILALTHIKSFELVAAVDNSLDADSGNANASSDGQFP